MNSHEKIVAPAVARGYPTSRERKQWTHGEWDTFNRIMDAKRDAEFAALPETDPRKLLARIEALEGRLDTQRAGDRAHAPGAGSRTTHRGTTAMTALNFQSGKPLSPDALRDRINTLDAQIQELAAEREARKLQLALIYAKFKPGDIVRRKEMKPGDHQQFKITSVRLGWDSESAHYGAVRLRKDGVTPIANQRPTSLLIDQSQLVKVNP